MTMKKKRGTLVGRRASSAFPDIHDVEHPAATGEEVEPDIEAAQDVDQDEVFLAAADTAFDLVSDDYHPDDGTAEEEEVKEESPVYAAPAEPATSTDTGKPTVAVKYLNNFVRSVGYGTDGAAGIDLRACMSGCRNRGTRLSAGVVTMFGTGIAVAIPEGHVGLIIMRSGKSTKDGIQLANQVAVIDSDYRGEVMLPLTTNRTSGAFVANGERVAQLVIVPCIRADIESVTGDLTPGAGTQKLGYLEIQNTAQLVLTAVQELPSTTRGKNGFGSTGSD